MTATLVSGVPTERGFTIAFAASAGALFVAFLAALAVPGRGVVGTRVARRKIAAVR